LRIESDLPHSNFLFLADRVIEKISE
jgi:hypothetical protein